MDYEKAYKKAFEIAKEHYHNEGSTAQPLSKNTIEKMFPELKEAEDERIRQGIMETIIQSGGVYGATRDEMIAWLINHKKSKQAPKWLYRLEYRDSSCGLWYNGKGEWCFDKGIGSLDDSCKTKSLPMGYDERYKQDGRDWFSSCSNKEDLLHWYSKNDAKKLLENGFVFTRYLATEYHEYENQTVFIKETALYREEIDFFELMGKQKPIVPLDENGEPMLSEFEGALFSTLSYFWQSYQLGEEINLAEFAKEYAPVLLEAIDAKEEKVEAITDGLNTEFQKQVSHLIASVINNEYEYTKGFVEYVAQSLLGYAKNELKLPKWTEKDDKMVKLIKLILVQTKGFKRVVTDARCLNWLNSLPQKLSK